MRLSRITLFFIALILGLGFYRLTSFLLEGIEAQTLQATEEAMVDKSQLLAAYLEGKQTQEERIQALEEFFAPAKDRLVDARIYNLEKSRIGLSAYLTDQDGVILFDSGQAERVGQNFNRQNRSREW